MQKFDTQINVTYANVVYTVGTLSFMPRPVFMREQTQLLTEFFKNHPEIIRNESKITIVRVNN